MTQDSQDEAPPPPAWQDRSLRVFETVFVLVVGISWLALVLGLAVEHGWQPSAILRALDDHWHPLLLLLMPILYRPVRIFLEEVQVAFGMDRRKSEEPPRETEVLNPEHKENGE